VEQMLLSKRDATIRSTDEQVSVLLELYDSEDRARLLDLSAEYVMARVDELRQLRADLRARLREKHLLPKKQDSETVSWDFLVDKIQGMLEEQPASIPLAEERKLLDLLDEILQLNNMTDVNVQKGRAATDAAIRKLHQGEGVMP
jgi:DNA-binding response OmpR family regulator